MGSEGKRGAPGLPGLEGAPGSGEEGSVSPGSGADPIVILWEWTSEPSIETAIVMVPLSIPSRTKEIVPSSGPLLVPVNVNSVMMLLAVELALPLRVRKSYVPLEIL